MSRRLRPFSLAFCVALSCGLACTLETRVARANPLDTFGYGSRGAAMGGALAADVKDASANYYNPAGLARARGFEASLGYMHADHRLAINGRDNHVDAVKGINAGLVVPGKLAAVPFAFGLALHLPDDHLSRVRALPQPQPRWELYDNRNQRLFFAANVALSPWPWLQIGGGLSFMSSTRGRLDITGSANVLRPTDSQLRHEVDADLTAIRYPQLGARVELSRRAALAVVYRGEFRLGLDLSARLKGDLSGLTSALYEIETSSVNAFLPKQIVFAGSFLPVDRLRVNLDATWINWSAYVSPVAEFYVKLDIPPPIGGWPSSIQPPTQPAPTRILPIRMRDRVVPRVGLEWRALSFHRGEAFVRGGYEFAKSPIPPQRGVTNFVDRDRHSFSVGLGAKYEPGVAELPHDLRLDVHAQWSELIDGATRKDEASDLVGDYSARGHIVNLGATLTVGFR